MAPYRLHGDLDSRPYKSFTWETTRYQGYFQASGDLRAGECNSSGTLLLHVEVSHGVMGQSRQVAGHSSCWL